MEGSPGSTNEPKGRLFARIPEIGAGFPETTADCKAIGTGDSTAGIGDATPRRSASGGLINGDGVNSRAGARTGSGERVSGVASEGGLLHSGSAAASRASISARLRGRRLTGSHGGGDHPDPIPRLGGAVKLGLLGGDPFAVKADLIPSTVNSLPIDGSADGPPDMPRWDCVNDDSGGRSGDGGDHDSDLPSLGLSCAPVGPGLGPDRTGRELPEVAISFSGSSTATVTVLGNVTPNVCLTLGVTFA